MLRLLDLAHVLDVLRQSLTGVSPTDATAQKAERWADAGQASGQSGQAKEAGGHSEQVAEAVGQAGQAEEASGQSKGAEVVGGQGGKAAAGGGQVGQAEEDGGQSGQADKAHGQGGQAQGGAWAERWRCVAEVRRMTGAVPHHRRVLAKLAAFARECAASPGGSEASAPHSLLVCLLGLTCSYALCWCCRS